ncbi:hypothetical protein XENOCAPTIV_017738, partial [Xenoophorus captivus]
VSLTPAWTLMTICGFTFSFRIITSTTGFLLSTLPVRPALQLSEPSGLHLRCRQTNHNSFSTHLSLPSFPTDFSPPRRIILQTTKLPVSPHWCFPPDLNTCSS